MSKNTTNFKKFFDVDEFRKKFFPRDISHSSRGQQIYTIATGQVTRKPAADKLIMPSPMFQQRVA